MAWFYRCREQPGVAARRRLPDALLEGHLGPLSRPGRREDAARKTARPASSTASRRATGAPTAAPSRSTTRSGSSRCAPSAGTRGRGQRRARVRGRTRTRWAAAVASEESFVVETPDPLRLRAQGRRGSRRRLKLRSRSGRRREDAKEIRAWRPRRRRRAAELRLRPAAHGLQARDHAGRSAEVYLRTGRTDLLEDFTSRFGRPFSATLVLKENGRHGFEFPPRTPRGAGGAGRGRKKATRKKATRKKARRKKARRKKAGTKKVARKKATGRKKAARKVSARRTPAAGAGEDA